MRAAIAAALLHNQENLQKVGLSRWNMENVIKFEHVRTFLDREEVLRNIDCYEDSPIYEEVISEFEEIKEEMMALCEPVLLLKFDVLDDGLVTEDAPQGSRVVYALFSIGDKISTYSTEAFWCGDYMKGMLSDAIADSLLFSLEREAEELLRTECAVRHVGIAKRLEAPVHIPMTAQRVIHEKTEAFGMRGIKISSGYMFEPVKSNGILFMLTENENVFKSQHDCRKCDRADCKMRNVPGTEVLVKEGDKQYTIVLGENESILEGMLKVGTYLSAVCGSKGTCGKCKIRMTEGELPVTEADRRAFSNEDLDKGFRLACKAYPTEWAAVETCFQKENDFEILSSHNEPDQSGAVADEDAVIAVDIGTTTIVLQLLGLRSGKILHTYSTINHQRAYGADVISRIQASCEGKKDELKKSIREDLSDGIKALTANSGISIQKIKRIAIAGNTTMTHLLMGYDCESLGIFPFTPVNINFIEDKYEEIPVCILPGISTFVGGDIVSGLLECGFEQAKTYSMLIDLGTNGEMAIGNKERILVTSTAAGPAFEGGNILWGTGSVAGAINSVRIEGQSVKVETIAGKTPIGICGTGVIETVSELVRNELVEPAGLLDEDYFEDGFPLTRTKAGEDIVFTQKDIREIQLAKAAVRAGIETLLLRYKITTDDIDTVYLAGGFGFKLDVSKAIAIGMFPEEFEGKIKTAGNSSLGGAMEYLHSEDGRERIEKITNAASEINLSSDKDFNEFYMDAMFFEKDQ